MRAGWRSSLLGYVLAGLVTAGAVALRWLLDPWLGDRLALVTLFPAVAAAVWFAGYRPALLTGATGYLACHHLFIARSGPATADALVGLLAYAVSIGILIAFGEALRAARSRANERHELLRITLASIGDAVITGDTDGRVTSLNAVAEALTGWTQAEAAGQPLEAVFHVVNEETREAVENPAIRTLREGVVVGLAYHSLLVAKDGTERPIDDSAAPIRDEQGRLAGCVLVFRDISLRRQAERALQRSERELADFFDNASVGLHWVGPDGTVLRANQAQLDMLGYSREEYLGHHVTEFHLDGPVIDDILARLARGETIRNHGARMRCKDGSSRDVLLSSNALFEDGRLVRSRCFMRDVTELRRAAEARARLAAIVAASDDAIISKALDGVILSWNAGAERIFGYTAAEAVGQSICLIIPPELQNEEQSILGRLRRGERVDHFETVRVAKDGRRLDISLTVSPIRDDAGQVVGASKIARDITDRKRAEQALRDADRRKDEFLATLAHELRNPLAPIRTSLEILKRAGGDAHMLPQARDMMERQLAHMVRLVDDLLDLSRITRDRLDLRKTAVDLHSVIHHAVETCRPLAEREHQAIEVALPDRPVMLEADPVRLAQVFSNLLNNACKYTPPRGTIRLGAERQGSDVVISVKDSGIGMPPERLESIFEMFAQVDDTLERSQGGLGIGLTLAKRLVELHGGSIAARSDGLGRGSEFVVRLPIPLRKPEQDGPAVTEVAPTAPPRRILVVDDNEDAADSLAMLLQLAGHETRVAHNGLQAVEVAARFYPDVILLDIGLPKLNGFDTCRRIREQPWGRQILMVALTGWGQDEDRRRSRDAGFDDHVVKPVDPMQLMRLLASLPSPQRVA